MTPPPAPSAAPPADPALLLSGDMSVLATNGRLHDGFLELTAGLPRCRDLGALGR
ncbi:hypothetical protein [Streptomyces varsoviensis]|uniref:hypothetical protein n=1 Tax=Streptomyces varsoviensis TaxID=67373 RepID=UPI000A8515A6|nr:hypothetical protein [Streptomyces varsoviensis]